MSAAILNTFPPVHTFNSSRSWAMAIIVLLHLGAFWALTAGMAVRLTNPGLQESTVRFVENRSDVKPPQQQKDVQIDERKVVIVMDKPTFDEDEKSNGITGEVVKTDELVRVAPEEPPTPARAVMVEPTSDPRVGLSQPDYPAPDIRAGNEGTVILSLQILETGRVGEVRIEHSSGFVRLDNSAVREARRWRFRPGTRGGVPVVMWKQLPVTFRLQQ